MQPTYMSFIKNSKSMEFSNRIDIHVRFFGFFCPLVHMLHALFSFSIFCRIYAIPTLRERAGYFHAFGSLLTISFDIYYSSFIWLRFWNILVKKYFWVCHRKYYRNTICLYAYICAHTHTCEKKYSMNSKTKVDCDLWVGL